MLYFLIIWTGLLSSCLTVGCGLLHRLKIQELKRASDRAILSSWLGLGSTAIALLATAIFTPLSPLTGLGLSTLLMLIALKPEPVRRELFSWWSQLTRWAWIGYGLCSIIAAAFVTQKVTWIDTGLYHYGLVQWLGEYGLLPGLSLINPQFGFTSAWFAIAAPLNSTGLAGSASTVMNGFILLLTILQIVLLSRQVFENSRRFSQSHLSDWFLLLFSFFSFLLVTQTPLLRTITISASPDIAVILFSMMAAWTMLLTDTTVRDHRQSEASGLDLVPVIIAVAAFSIKLTALPLLIATVGFYLSRVISLKRVVTAIALLFTTLLPFITAQILASGYPLYPSTIGGLSLPWTRAPRIANRLAEATHGWGNWFRNPPLEVYRPAWLIQKWFNSNHSSKLMVFLIVLSVISGIALAIRLRTKRDHRILWLLVLAVLGITFTMLKAPLFRFGMGYFLLLPVLSGALLCHRTTYQAKVNLKPLNGAAIAIGLIGTITLSKVSYANLANHLLLAPPLPSITYQQQEINGITYIVTQNSRSQCWSAPLPCVYSPRSKVKLRNPQIGIRGGFISDEAAVEKSASN